MFVYILKMCTSYYGLIWRLFSYIFCMLNLVIFYHYMSWMVPSWCNLKLQQCSLLNQSILFRLCTVFVYILKMCTSYYGLIWRLFSYIFCMLNLVIFYHYMSWMVPSWCNLKLQQCSLLNQSILFRLCTVFVYILKMCTSYYGLIWRLFSYIFCMLNLVIFYHYMSWMVPSWCNLKLQQCSLLNQSILFRLCTVFVYILKMCISYYGLIWQFFSLISCMLNLVIFYHYMTLTVPSWCNLKL